MADPQFETLQNPEELSNAKNLLLQSKGQNASQFDEIYGPGSAVSVLSGKYELPPQPEEQGMLSNIWDGVKDTLAAIPRGAIGAGAELRQTYENFGAITPEQFEATLNSFIAKKEEARGTLFTQKEKDMAFLEQRSNYEKMGINISNPEDRVDYDADTALKNIATATGGAVDLTETLGKPETILGGITETVTQFATGYLALGGGRSVIAGLLKGAAVDATVFDPFDENMSAMMQDTKWAVPYLTEALATDQDGTEWENRMRNSVEGGILGGALEGLIWTFKLARARKKAKLEVKENGSISDETLAELTEADEGIKTIADLETKPKGKFTPEGNFETPEGLVFDPEGIRRTDLEKITVTDEQVKLASDWDVRTAKEGAATPTNLDGLDVVSTTTARVRADAGNLDVTRADAPTIEASGVKIDDVSGVTTAPKRTAADVELPAVSKLDTPEIGVAPKVIDNVLAPVEVQTSVAKPKVPKRPSNFISTAGLQQIVVRAKKTNEIINIGQLGVEGDNLGLFNWNNMDGPIDAFKVMDSTQQALADSGVLSKMGLEKPETLAQVHRDASRSVAALADADVDVVTKNFMDAEKITRTSAQRIVAGKMILQSTGRRISDLADIIDKLKKTKDTDTAVERQLVDLLRFHADIQASVKGIQTATARAVSAGRIRTADALGDDILDRLTEFGGSKAVQKLAGQIKAAGGNPRAKARLIRKANENKIWGVINEVWLNAILSGPKTHLLNMGANGFNMVLRPGIRAVGGTITGMITKDFTAAQEGVRQYMYLISEISESMKYMTGLARADNDSAMKNAFMSFRRGEGVLDTASKFDPTLSGNSRAISSQGTGAGAAVVNSLGNAARLPGRFLQAEDEFFKQMIFRSRMKAIVTTQATKLSKADLKELGYKDKDAYIVGEVDKGINSKETLTEKWDHMVKGGQVLPDEAAKALFIKQNLGAYNHTNDSAVKALDEARESTFTTPLRNGTVTANFQKVIAQHPWMRQIMPFVQTPTNILRVSVERMPAINFLMKRQRDILKNGTPDEKAILAGNQAMGVGLTVLAYNLASQGMITGGGPSYASNPNENKLWNASPDWQPYSVNMGTKEKPDWIELKKLDPHGMVFGIIGDLYEMTEYWQDDPNPEVMDLTAMVAASFANNVMSKSYMMSLTDTMALFDGTATGNKFKNFADYRLASMIPYSSMSYEINKQVTGQMTELRTTVDRLKSRIPFADDGTVKHDWLTGEAVNTPEYRLGFIRRKRLDSGEHVAAGVYEELRKLNHGFAGPQRTLGDIELNPNQYQRYNELVGTIDVRGKKTLIQQLDEEIKSSRYARMADSAEINQPESADDPRVKRINFFIQRAKEKARRQLFKEYPDLASAFRQNKINRKKMQSGNDADPLILSID